MKTDTRIKGTLHEDRYTFSISPSFIYLFLGWIIFQTDVAEKLETHILCSRICFLFRKSCSLWDNVGKCRVRQATDDNMAHAHCMLDNWGYKCTHRLCNSHCFSTTTMVTRTPLSVTIYLTFPVFNSHMFHLTLPSVTDMLWWIPSKKHNYKLWQSNGVFFGKEELHVSAYSGHLQVLKISC